jgi:hypothetical protein
MAPVEKAPVFERVKRAPAVVQPARQQPLAARRRSKVVESSSSCSESQSEESEEEEIVRKPVTKRQKIEHKPEVSKSLPSGIPQMSKEVAERLKAQEKLLFG